MGGYYTWRVEVAGVNVADIVPDAEAVITYGRQEVMDQPAPTTCVVELFTVDAAPDYIARYPQFALGDHAITTGFEPRFHDVYLGDSSKVTLGAPVTISLDTATGFRDAFVDLYDSGLNLTRFVGKVVAIDWAPDRVTLTCAPAIHDLTRQQVTPDQWPEELDTDRAQRIWDGITTQGDGVPVVPLTGDRPVTKFQLLRDLAEQTGGMFWEQRDGTITFRSVTVPPDTFAYPLPAEAVPIGPLGMSAELAQVINEWNVDYGVEDPATNKRPSVTSQVSDSIHKFGLSQETMETQLAALDDATDFADMLVAATAEPRWAMPSAQVDLFRLPNYLAADVATLDLGDLVTVDHLLAGAPTQTYTAQVLGMTETVSALAWSIQFHLAPGDTAAATTRRMNRQ